MKRLIRPMLHLPGLAVCSGSTESEAMASAGKSVMKLVIKICLGSIGRNGSMRDAPATLNIFPNVAPVELAGYRQQLRRQGLDTGKDKGMSPGM